MSSATPAVTRSTSSEDWEAGKLEGGGHGAGGGAGTKGTHVRKGSLTAGVLTDAHKLTPDEQKHRDEEKKKHDAEEEERKASQRAALSAMSAEQRRRVEEQAAIATRQAKDADAERKLGLARSVAQEELERSRRVESSAPGSASSDREHREKAQRLAVSQTTAEQNRRIADDADDRRVAKLQEQAERKAAREIAIRGEEDERKRRVSEGHLTEADKKELAEASAKIKEYVHGAVEAERDRRVRSGSGATKPATTPA